MIGAAVLLAAGGGAGAWWLTRGGPAEPSGSTAAAVVNTTTGAPPATATTTAAAPVTTAPSQEVADGWAWSGDQQAVLAAFGVSDTFTLAFGTDPEDVLPGAEVHRIEYWDYYDMGVRFVFRDGAVVATGDIPRLGPEYDYPAVTADRFVAGMDVDDVVWVMGGEPTSGADLVPSLGEDFVLLVWNDVVAVSFVDGVVSSVETAPVEVSR